MPTLAPHSSTPSGNTYDIFEPRSWLNWEKELTTPCALAAASLAARTCAGTDDPATDCGFLPVPASTSVFVGTGAGLGVDALPPPHFL